MLTVELVCHHAPHKCRCRHNFQTEVDRSDLAVNLVKYNPNLLKYLGKRINSQPTLNVLPAKEPETIVNEGVEADPNYRYRSIVQEKQLPFCLDRQPQPFNRQVQAEIKPASPRQLKHYSPIVSPQKDSNQNEEVHNPNLPNRKEKPKEGQVIKFHKQMRQQSRYLSDTAFRKYFSRQCFQNYGRNNTSHKADGFVYGNYMKTHNINPHSGENLPINEQTFYHALVSGNPVNYTSYAEEVQIKTENIEEKIPELNKSLQKSRLNVEKMLADNLKHSRIEKKYENLHLKPKKQTEHKPVRDRRVSKQQKNVALNQVKSQKSLKGPSHLQINTKKQFKQHHFRQSQAPDPRQSKMQALQPNTKSIMVEQKLPNRHRNDPSGLSINQHFVQQEPNQHSVQQQNSSSQPQFTCDHRQSQRNLQCPSCLDKMKRMILELSEKDPDLAERLVSSAKKHVMYKNFALNNYQNAPMNPHNFRSVDGKLNIYQG